MKGFLALITARGGSKGLPRKNILDLNGKPLIAWTIKAAVECSKIERVFVSTDDEEISRISRAYGAEIINRPKELALDNSSSIEVINHAISWFSKNNVFCDNMVLLQPTSPLRNSGHLDEALKNFEKNNANLIISVFEPEHTPFKSYVENKDGSIRGLYHDEAPYMRRQDLPVAYQPNGAIYAFSTIAFKENNTFPTSKVYPYIMSKEDSIDIDTIAELKYAENIMKEKENE
ncbi:acylneuraminate cytidylyltransferase family protein [Vibrio parahaemolyticus]